MRINSVGSLIARVVRPVSDIGMFVHHSTRVYCLPAPLQAAKLKDVMRAHWKQVPPLRRYRWI
jgi:hypothetical protein